MPASFLKNGKNELEILAYCQNESSFIYRKGEPSLIYEIETDGQVLTYSSEETLTTRNVGFRSGAVELLTKQHQLQLLQQQIFPRYYELH